VAEVAASLVQNRIDEHARNPDAVGPIHALAISPGVPQQISEVTA
jgi:hypothetical protein